MTEGKRTESTARPPLRAIEGGREALERQYLWAIVFGDPERETLKRRLCPSANASLLEVEPSNPQETLQRSPSP